MRDIEAPPNNFLLRADFCQRDSSSIHKTYQNVNAFWLIKSNPICFDLPSNLKLPSFFLLVYFRFILIKIEIKPWLFNQYLRLSNHELRFIMTFLSLITINGKVRDGPKICAKISYRMRIGNSVVSLLYIRDFLKPFRITTCWIIILNSVLTYALGLISCELIQKSI